MSTAHLSPDLLVQYVSGLIDDRSAADVDRHVQCCPRCDAALMREARVELVLQELGTQRSHKQRDRSVRKIAQHAAGILGAFAFAAAVLLFVMPKLSISADGNSYDRASVGYSSADASTHHDLPQNSGDGAPSEAAADF